MANKFTSTLPVSNSRPVPHIVAVEPWGADFTLLPGESLDVIATGDKVEPWFQVVEDVGISQVFCEDASSFEVTQDGVALECGHKRQSSQLG